MPVEANPPLFKVRLGLDPGNVSPGAGLSIRIENVGAKDVAYGLAYEMARFENGVWIMLPTGPFLAPRFNVPARTASRCQKVHIPRLTPSGLYRIRKQVVQQTGASSSSVRAVTATFRVVE